MDRRKLFRQAALDKMESPERLDELMVVTAPWGWCALATTGLVLVAIVLWSLLGTIAIKVRGQGILIRGDAVLAVTVGSTGRLSDVQVRPGDVVQKGEIVATVSQPDLSLQAENTQEELDSLLAQDKQQLSSEERILSQLRGQRRELAAKIANQRQMLERGLVTRGTLLATQSQLATVDQSIARHQAAADERTNRIESVRHELEELQGRMAEEARIVSPYTGRVLELMLDSGNMVGPGMPLLTLESLEGPVDAVIYVGAGDGKKVRPGMQVRVSPSTVRSEEYGFMLGEVRSVSVYPVTPEGIARVLRNERLVSTLTGDGAPIEIVASLHPDDATESGYRWSSSKGPPSKVFTGTVCGGSVIVEKKRPISYVLPILREALGSG